MKKLLIIATSLLSVCVFAVQQVNAQVRSSAKELNYQQTIQRGTQAVIWGMPAVSMMGLRKSAESQLGSTFNDVVYFSKPLVSRHGFLTANNDVPYVVTILDTTNGPVILDVPPSSEKTLYFGTAIDAWEVPIVNIGPQGEDAGKGGKYLFLPPGFNGNVPSGYMVQQPATFHIYVGLRPVSVNVGTLEQAVEYAKLLTAYLCLANCYFPSHRACNNVSCLVLLNLLPLNFELDVADS